MAFGEEAVSHLQTCPRRVVRNTNHTERWMDGWMNVPRWFENMKPRTMREVTEPDSFEAEREVLYGFIVCLYTPYAPQIFPYSRLYCSTATIAG